MSFMYALFDKDSAIFMPQIYLRDGAEEFMGLLNDWSVFGKTLNIGSFAGNVSLAFVFFNLKYDKGQNRLKTFHFFTVN